MHINYILYLITYSITHQARQLLDSAENDISILERRIQSLNNSLQSVRESFARNRQQLLSVRRLTKETENRTGQLEEVYVYLVNF